MTSLFPPFDPNERKGGRRRFTRIPIQYVIPNLVTLLALCAGLTGIRMAIEGRYDLAIGAVVLAAILDGLDGRVARMLKSASRFGAELDSLTDFVNFGVAPAIILYVWILNEVKSLGWIAALIFAICTALRLARFNVALDAPDKPDWQNNFFVGIPAPAGALTVLLPVYLEQIGVPHYTAAAPVILTYTILIGMLMVSKVPTFSGKKFGKRVPRDMVLPLFVVVVLAVAFLASYPFQVLTAISVGYLATLPLSWISWRRNMAKMPEPEKSEAEENSTDTIASEGEGEADASASESSEADTSTADIVEISRRKKD